MSILRVEGYTDRSHFDANDGKQCNYIVTDKIVAILSTHEPVRTDEKRMPKYGTMVDLQNGQRVYIYNESPSELAERIEQHHLSGDIVDKKHARAR